MSIQSLSLRNYGVFRSAEFLGLSPLAMAPCDFVRPRNLARAGGGRLAYLAPTRAALSLAEERWPANRFAATCEHEKGCTTDLW